MSDRIAAFDRMAFDLGIYRCGGEDNVSFCQRVAYSAARPWVSAYCLDDGFDGREGLAKQGINRRLKAWVEVLEDVRPGMRTWFNVDGDGLSYIYNRLIDLGDIVPNGYTGRFLARAPIVLPICDGCAIIVGFIDNVSGSGEIRDIPQHRAVTSGLATFVTTDTPGPEYQPSWWETDLEYMPWLSAKDFGELEYANPWCRNSRWSLRRSDAWRDDPELVDGLTLARPSKATVSETQYYACRRAGRSLFLSRIDWLMAQELFFYIRMRKGNGAVAAYQPLDDRHVRLAIPATIVPGQYGRILGSIAWPVDDVRGGGTYIARAEVMPIVRDLLSRSYFSLREVKR